jgi:hypothetical protein
MLYGRCSDLAGDNNHAALLRILAPSAASIFKGVCSPAFPRQIETMME